MKNALLLFLSEIHLTGGRQVSTEYKTKEFGKIQCYQTNEASIKYLMKKLATASETIDCIVAFSTNKTQSSITYINDENIQVKKKQRDIFWDNIIKEYPQLIVEDKPDYDPLDELLEQEMELKE